MNTQNNNGEKQARRRKRKGRTIEIKITKNAVKQAQSFALLLIIGVLIGVVMIMSVWIFQLTQDIAQIKGYLERAFPVEPSDIADVSKRIQRLPWLTKGQANFYALHICIEAERNGVDPHLVRSLIYWESQFDEKAISDKKCVGLMQLNPAIFKLAVETLANPAINIPLGVRHLAECIQRARGNEEYGVRLYHGNPRDPASIELGKRVMKRYYETRAI